MKKYIKILTPYGKDEIFETEYNYELGDEILLNSKRPCRCVKVEEVDSDKIFVFKEAIIMYDYNW